MTTSQFFSEHLTPLSCRESLACDIRIQIEPLDNLLDSLMSFFIREREFIAGKTLDEPRKSGYRFAMLLKIFFRREESWVKEFHKGIYLVGVKLHRSCCEKEHSTAGELIGFG